MRGKEPSEIVFRILKYLCANPNAQDTLDGISNWWMAELAIRQRRIRVEMAVHELVSRGLLVRFRSPDGQIRFRLEETQRLTMLSRFGGDADPGSHT